MKAIDPSGSRHPDIALAIFKQGDDGIAGEPVSACELINLTAINVVDSLVERTYPKCAIPVPQEGRDLNVFSVEALCGEGPRAKRRCLLQSQMGPRPRKPEQHRGVGRCKECYSSEILRVAHVLPNERSHAGTPLACTEQASDPEFSRGVLRDGIADVTRLAFGYTKASQRSIFELAKAT